MTRRVLIACVVVVSLGCSLSCRTMEVSTQSELSDTIALLVKGDRQDNSGS